MVSVPSLAVPMTTAVAMEFRCVPTGRADSATVRLLASTGLQPNGTVGVRRYNFQSPSDTNDDATPNIPAPTRNRRAA
jgi:hypothetical protein